MFPSTLKTINLSSKKTAVYVRLLQYLAQTLKTRKKSQNKSFNEQLKKICNVKSKATLAQKISFVKKNFAQIIEQDKKAELWKKLMQRLGVHHYLCDHTIALLLEHFLKMGEWYKKEMSNPRLSLITIRQ